MLSLYLLLQSFSSCLDHYNYFLTGFSTSRFISVSLSPKSQRIIYIKCKLIMSLCLLLFLSCFTIFFRVECKTFTEVQKDFHNCPSSFSIVISPGMQGPSRLVVMSHISPSCSRCCPPHQWPVLFVDN